MKNNKGFSLVELIIVIAIMAILAGALAPALIKYINKSRRSADIANADTIRTACQTALSDEDAASTIKDDYKNKTSVSTIMADGTAFGNELKSILGSKEIKSKYFAKGKVFSVAIDMGNNSVIVYADSQQVCPEPNAAAAGGK